MKTRLAFLVLAVGLLLTWCAPEGAFGAVRVTRAELIGGNLRLEGQGALPNAPISIDGVTRGTADGAGAFRIQLSGFSAPSCTVRVSDGATLAQATLAGCTPSSLPALSSVTLFPPIPNPPSVVGGIDFLPGQIGLSAAPSAATVVNLSSSNPVVATVPASVTVVAGVTFASFNVTTARVTTSTTITISASFAGVTKTALLTVLPITFNGLNGLTIFPAGVASFRSTRGFVRLSVTVPVPLLGPAGGGVTVGLSSSNPLAATVPASVTIPPGSSGAIFIISGLPVTAFTSVTITATIPSGSTSAQLIVAPAAPLPAQNDCGSGLDAGDTVATAVPVTLPVTCTGDLTAIEFTQTLCCGDFVDAYTFTVPQAFELLSVSLQNFTGFVDLYDPDGAVRSDVGFGYTVDRPGSGRWC